MSDFYSNNNGENSRYNNSNNQISVSTSMLSMWDSATAAQLKLSVLNNGLSVAIWLPFINPDGSRKYPTENRFSTLLTQKNALAFERIINEHIIPAYEKGVNAHAGIFTNSAQSNMVELEVRDGNFFVLMHRNCDPTTRIPKDTIRFKFESTNIVEGYDSVSGELNAIPIQADFFVFAKAVYAYNDLVAGALAAHGASVATSQANQRFMEYIRAIADAVHAQLPAPSYQQNGGYRPQSNTGVQHNYNAESNSGGPAPVVSTTEVSSLSDLIG